MSSMMVTLHVTVLSISRLSDEFLPWNLGHPLPLFILHLVTFEFSYESKWISRYSIFPAALTHPIHDGDSSCHCFIHFLDPWCIFAQNIHHSLPLFSTHLVTFEFSCESKWISGYSIFPAALTHTGHDGDSSCHCFIHFLAPWWTYATVKGHLSI